MDNSLYKGIFWILNPQNIVENKQVCLKIPCDRFGNVQQGDYDLNAKKGSNLNHRKTWMQLDKKTTGSLPYNYYPRGRIEIAAEKATIYCNPHIATQELLLFISDNYNLTPENGIINVRIVADGSSHYRCYLDE